MSRRVARAGALIVAVVILAGCGPVQIVDRDRAGRPILIRSPEPSASQRQALVAEHGVRTVVNLRGESHALEWARLGVHEVHLPVSAGSSGLAGAVDRFLEVVEDPAHRPVLVHCQSGIHRTGVFVAIYRRELQGWATAEVIDEMEANRFDLTWHDVTRYKEFVRSYSTRKERRAAAKRP